jgi:hypothetical protein
MTMTLAVRVTGPLKPLEIAHDLLARIPVHMSQDDRMLRLGRKLLDYYKLWDWSVGVHGKKTALGLCSFSKCTITIQRTYAQVGDQALVIDTILHEIAHALVGPGKAHGLVWQAKAVELGARPTTAKRVAFPDSYYKWFLSCPSDLCSQRSKYHRKPGARVLKFHRCMCGKEGSKMPLVLTQVK